MLNCFKYIFKGMLHYINLIFGLLDFRDLGFMWVIIIGLIVLGIINKDVRYGIKGLFRSTINVIKTIPGFLFLVLFLSYYIYIAIFFEERITIVIFILSIYLFAQDFLKTNFNLLLESENNIWNSIKDFSLPVIMLCIQQISMMFENNNFNNLNYVLLSLAIIPIFSLLFFVMKHYCIYTDFYARNKKYIKINDYLFFKIFNDCLVECGTYKLNEKVLSKFILDNKNLSYEELKQKYKKDIKNLILYEKEFLKISSKKIKSEKSKLFKLFNFIWILNIIIIIVIVICKRFLNVSNDFLYYCSFSILIIYFWYDLMKIKNIENQYDYMIYMFIYIVLIIFLLIYNSSLNSLRLTELGFLVPIFIIIRAYTYYKDFPNLLTLPFLSEKNFF